MREIEKELIIKVIEVLSCEDCPIFDKCQEIKSGGVCFTLLDELEGK